MKVKLVTWCVCVCYLLELWGGEGVLDLRGTLR